MRKPTKCFPNRSHTNQACTATENSSKLEISDLRREGIALYPCIKTMSLFSCAVSAQLNCAFVFAYADCWFSDVVAHILNTDKENLICKSFHVKFTAMFT